MSYLRIVNILMLFAPLSAAVLQDGPKAVFPETVFVFGTARLGVAVEHEFILRNEGTAPLRILAVRPSPYMMLGRMPAQIAPKAEVKMRVQLDTSKLSGPFKGQVLISLNDPARPEATLQFEGRIVLPIELSPRPMFMVAAQRGEKRESAIEIINHEPEPLTIKSVEHPKERFATKLETLEEGRRYRLSLVINPDGPAGKNTEKIIIRTSSYTMPVIEISANTYLRERVYTFPEDVDLGSVPLSEIQGHPEVLQRMMQTLMVYQVGGSNFQAKMHTDLAMLDLKVERGPKGDRYQSTITLIAAKVKPGPIKGSIIIETNDPKFPRLTVPVTGSIF